MLPEELCWEICQFISTYDPTYLTMWVLSGIYAKSGILSESTKQIRSYSEDDYFSKGYLYKSIQNNKITYYSPKTIFDYIRNVNSTIFIGYNSHGHHQVTIRNSVIYCDCVECMIVTNRLYDIILKEIVSI